MNGFEVYQKYVAIKTHFAEGPYDYFKYNGKMNIKYGTYDRRNDKSFFEVVARKISEKDIVPFLVSNFIENDEMWIGDLIENYEDAHTTFTQWKKKMFSLYQVYEEDLKNIVEFLDEKELALKDLFVYNTTHPLIFRFMLQGMIEKETFILLDDIIHFIDILGKKIKNDIIWDNEISRINRYRRFVVYDKSKVSSITKSILIP